LEESFQRVFSSLLCTNYPVTSTKKGREWKDKEKRKKIKKGEKKEFFVSSQL